MCRWVFLLVAMLGPSVLAQTAQDRTARVRVGIYAASTPRQQPTACREPYDPARLTAAHRTLPCGTLLRVTNPRTNATVTVRINDRAVTESDQVLVLTPAAARAVDFTGASRELSVTLTAAERANVPAEALRYLFDPRVPPPAPSAPSDTTKTASPVVTAERFTVQLALFTDVQRARAYASQQPLPGLWVQTAKEPTGVIYRVCHGLFATREQATAARDLLRSRGVDGFIRSIPPDAEAPTPAPRPAPGQVRW